MERILSTPKRAAVVAAVLGALMLGCYLLVGYSFKAGHETACERADVTLDVLHDLLAEAKASVDRSSRVHVSDRLRADRFYGKYLTRIEEVRC